LIREIQLIIMPQALKKGLIFNTFIDSKCYCELTGAYDQIKQILINLLGNSVKFTDRGRITLSVLSDGSDDSFQNIVFKVSDTGIGIAYGDQSKVFKPFVQGNNEISQNYEGSGLGISISDELARLMGGTLALESQLERGTTFRLSIRLKVNEENQTIYPENIKICPVNIAPAAQKVINFYRDYGFIIICDDITETDKYKSIRYAEPSIIIYQDNKACPLNGVEKRIVRESSALKIRIMPDSGSVTNDNLAVTNIRPDSCRRELINAINIARELVIFHKDKDPELPQSEREFNILIAEDDPTLQEIYKLVFSRTKHNLTLVNNGNDALRLLINRQFNLAVLDLRMPDMNGIAVARRYHNHSINNRIPLILLTADQRDIHAYQDVSLFDRILIKPIKPTDLLTSIYDCLDRNINSECSDIDRIKSSISATHDDEHIEEDIPLINFDVINDYLRICSIEELQDIIDLYDSEVREQCFRLDKAIAHKDQETMHNVLHRLKGVSMSIGAVTFGDYVRRLLLRISSTCLNESRDELKESIFRIHEKSVNGLKEFCINKR